jgi:hypothetical protein
MAWATLSIPPFRKFARLGHRFDELSKRDRFLRTDTMFLISIPAYPQGSAFGSEADIRAAKIFLPAQTSNGISSLDPVGNANTFCISSSLQKIVSYQSCLGCWSPQLL